MIQKTHQISFHFFDIGGGDAIYIRFFGDDSQWHNILIDGGYGYAYKEAFGPLINEIISMGEKIDLWIISHIDLDHIGAVLGFFNARKIIDKPSVVNNFLFNHSPRPIHIPTGKAGVNQGIALREFLQKNNYNMTLPITNSTEPLEIAGLKITFLSPTPEKEALATSLWEAEERTKKIGRNAEQSDHMKSVEELKDNSFASDTDATNGSSIAVFVEFQDKKAVLLADSHPKDIVDSIANLEPDKSGPLEVSFLQLSHHGSKANNSPELFEVIKTENYVVTGNGIHNQHPDKEALVRVLNQENRAAEVLQIHFACDTPQLRNLFNVDRDAYEKYKFSCTFGQLGLGSTQLSYLPLNEEK